MSAIFISHSSNDNAWAERIAVWLKELGYESLFLDFDPLYGIPAGRDWKKELHHKLQCCRAVIALLSDDFRTSEWCLSEVAIASNLGKSLFPVRIGPCELPNILRDHQAIDLTIDADDGLKRLARGLVEAGLDPRDIFQWDSSRSPYPGLMAFQEADSPVFFGRDREVQEGLDQIHNLRRYGGRALLLVLGASGCGKSSLVRAGLVPRLRRDGENWLVLNPFRPGHDPFAELADVLARASRAVGETPPAPPIKAQSLKEQLEALRHSSGHRQASVVLVIDQFEELLSDNAYNSDTGIGLADIDVPGSATANHFLAFLHDLTSEPNGQLVVLITLRSDFLGSFQCHPALVGVSFADLKLGPMDSASYARVIEGPAQVAGLDLEPGLADRMVSDTRTGDALPLLAFTLRELWERYGSDGDLRLTEYERIGGLEGSVQRAADGVLAASQLNPQKEEALRRAFLQMCRINEDGQHARIVARWEAMPPASRETLQRFVEARLLVSGKESGTIEVAHEALLRTWPLLKGWLVESREYLLWKSRFQSAVGEYERTKTLLTGKPLEEAERWLSETVEDSVERRLINHSIQARNWGVWRRNIFVAGAVTLLAGFTAEIWWQLQNIRQWQTEVFAADHLRKIETDPLESVVNGLATMARSVDSDPGRSLALTVSLPRAMANNFAITRQPTETGQEGVYSLIELNNGELISGGFDGTLRRWRDGKALGEVIDTGQIRVLSLVELNNGELISGGENGTLRRWRDGKPVGEAIQTGQGRVLSLVELKNDELISGGENGTLQRWRDGRPIGAAIATGQGGVWSLIELKNGELISGGENGTLRRWRDGKPIGAAIDTGQGGVLSLIELNNGELISGGENGTLQRWRDGRPTGAAIATGQGGVLSLIELDNGELISGGETGTLRRWRDGRPIGAAVATGQGRVWSLIELNNGELISGGLDGTLRRWRDGTPVRQVIVTGQGGVLSLIELNNGELISGGENGTLQRWRDGRPIGAAIATGQGGVLSLIELNNGELISGGENGTLRRWRNGKPVGEPIETGQRRVLSLIELKNGDLISGGVDGSLRRWRNGKPAGEPIETGQDGVWSLIELKNGELISGGFDGLRRWRDGKPVGEPIETGQGVVRNLIELKNGELISGGENGTLRRWRDGKPKGETIFTDQGVVWSLIKLKNGELISGGENGTLFSFSPRTVIEFACRRELPELMRSPESLPDKEASALCNRLGFL